MPLISVIYTIFRSMLHPLILLSVKISPSLRKRWDFEGKNERPNDSFQASFRKSNERAERCYHVSSEGEWEQAWPFVLEDLREGLKTEVLYTSESLEKRVTQSKLALNSELIRFWRLPLLRNHRLEDWVSARGLVMCRYDFFPELIFLGLRCQRLGGRFTLLSGSLKNKKKMLQREGAFPFVYWSWLYQKFDRICLASGLEKERFMTLGLEVTRLWSYEARALQILLRLKNHRHTLEQRGLQNFVQVLEETSSKEQRLIFGSAWPSDLGVLRQTLANTKSIPQVVIAPHDLSEKGIEQLERGISPVRDVLICDHTTKKNQLAAAARDKKVLIFIERGVLLELYPLFGHAYIGGGFGRSIHSVLEPFLAQSQVYCGVKTHRSTEVDMIEFERPERLEVLPSDESGLELEKRPSRDESVAKVLPPSYYENLYENELHQLKAARDFLFARKG